MPTLHPFRFHRSTIIGLVSTLVVGSGSLCAAAVSSEAVDALFADYAAPGSPGAAVGIYQGGKLIYSQAYGYADLEQGTKITPQTPFHVASVSKEFTAFAIALLSREHKVDLDADIRTYLPYLPDFGHKITSRHLLYHTSGLRDQWSLFQLGGQDIHNVLRQQQAVNMMMRQRELNFEPGAAHLYCNTGFTLLAEIVRTVSGRTLRQFTTERIFQPLGMSHTFFYDDVTEIVPGRAQSYKKAPSGGGWKKELLNYDIFGATSLFTTVEDLAKWAGNFTHPLVGDRALIDEITTPGRLNDGSQLNYGFGLTLSRIAGRRAISHSGSDAGFRAYFLYFPAEDFAVAITANTPFEQDQKALAVAKLYLPATVPDDIPKAVDLDAALGAALAGVYLPPYDGSLTVEWRNGHLLLRAEPVPVRLVFRQDGTFDKGTHGTHYRPLKNDDGTIRALEKVTADGNRPVVYTRVEPLKMADAALAELVGDYRCPELDITYSFVAREGQLVASSIWGIKPVPYKPVAKDRFESEKGDNLTVDRDSAGRPTGLRFSSSRIRHVLLQKF